MKQCRIKTVKPVNYLSAIAFGILSCSSIAAAEHIDNFEQRLEHRRDRLAQSERRIENKRHYINKRNLPYANRYVNRLAVKARQVERKQRVIDKKLKLVRVAKCGNEASYNRKDYRSYYNANRNYGQRFAHRKYPTAKRTYYKRHY